MNVTNAFLYSSEVDINKFPKDGLFEIVLIGKSNVGKSSFINAMTNRKSLARTSSAPGKTRTANFYIINDRFYFVDMPGYGYAEVSKSQKGLFDKIIKDYVKKRKTDFMVLFFLDGRHLPTRNDVKAYNMLLDEGITPVVILTKTDKQKKYVTDKNTAQIKKILDIKTAVFPFSIKQPESAENIWRFIDEIIQQTD